MGKRVILTLMSGNFEQGFPVILRIREDGTPAEAGIQVLGKLPPAPNILELFKQWQSAYRQMVMPCSRIKPKPVQITNFSCRELGLELTDHLNDWLNSGSREWQKIRDRLQQNLSQIDEIQIIIETDDIRLRQLPWHLWDLFSEYYTGAEIALSAPEYQPPSSRTVFLTDKIRILAILGNSTGINVQKDRAMLEHLPDAETTFLVEPQRQELNNQLWDQQWKILFFAGHSSSQMDGNTGQIYINQTDSLSLAELKNALRRAIEGGLQLAIFNSCDGLGLAQALADLHIPQVIVMREPVPDLVAQEFLRHFLATFSSGRSLYASVREARERLQKLEGEYPCATWLPVICQNPAQVPTTWQDWCGVLKRSSATGNEPQNRQTLPVERRSRAAFLASGKHVAKSSLTSVSTSAESRQDSPYGSYKTGSYVNYKPSYNRLNLIIALSIAALVTGGAGYAYLKLQFRQGTSSLPTTKSAIKTNPHIIERVPTTKSAIKTNPHTTERVPTASATKANPHTTERVPADSKPTTNSVTTEPVPTSSGQKTNPRTAEPVPTDSDHTTNSATFESLPKGLGTTTPATPESSPTASDPTPATPESLPTASESATNSATPESSPTASDPASATPEPSPTASSTTTPTKSDPWLNN